MTRCILTAALLAALVLPAAAQRPPWMSPHASVKVRFQPPDHDAWTVRTVLDHRLTLELSSTGASRSTTLTARRVLLAREELKRTRRGFERTTTLRAITAERNGRPEARPAEISLLGRRLGLRLSKTGRPTGTIGVTAARDAVTEPLQGFLHVDDPSAGLADAAPEDDMLRDAWEADAGRYLGQTLARDEVLLTVERVRLPFLRGRMLNAVSESKVRGPVVVAGRPGVAVDVAIYSLDPTRLTTDEDLADWVGEVKLKPPPAGCRILGGGRRVVALDGRGVLDEDMTLEVHLTGPLAAEAGNVGPPPGRVKTATTRALRLVLGRKRTVLSEMAVSPEKPPRSAPARGATRTGRTARSEED